MGGDALALAVAHHRRFGRCQRHERSHRALGARLLEEAEQRVEHDDGQDDHGLVGQGALARVLQHPFDNGNDGGDEKDDDQEILELFEEPPPPGRFGGALQLIGPVLLEALARFGAAQAEARIGAQGRDNRLGILPMRHDGGRGGAIDDPRGRRSIAESFVHEDWPVAVDVAEAGA